MILLEYSYRLSKKDFTASMCSNVSSQITWIMLGMLRTFPNSFCPCTAQKVFAPLRSLKCVFILYHISYVPYLLYLNDSDRHTGCDSTQR